MKSWLKVVQTGEVKTKNNQRLCRKSKTIQFVQCRNNVKFCKYMSLSTKDVLENIHNTKTKIKSKSQINYVRKLGPSK